MYFLVLNFKPSYYFSGRTEVPWKNVDFTDTYFISIPQYLKGDWTGELAWNKDTKLVCWGAQWLSRTHSLTSSCPVLPVALCEGCLAAQWHRIDTCKGLRLKLSWDLGTAHKTTSFFNHKYLQWEWWILLVLAVCFSGAIRVFMAKTTIYLRELELLEKALHKCMTGTTEINTLSHNPATAV